jgi:hypothetical protein
LNDKITFQGIVTKFNFVSSRKISQILPVFKYNSSVSTQSHDILANYVASSVQWYKCFGTLRPRGNTKKPKTPDEMIARLKQDSGSAKRLKNEPFDVEDFTLNYDSPLEDFKEVTHEKQYSPP